jgi:phage recombination protein Bet
MMSSRGVVGQLSRMMNMSALETRLQMSNVATLPDKTRSVTVYMAERYGMEPAAFESTLRATVIKPDKNGRAPSREEFAAFLLVAKEYGLNPITKEIYAFTDKGAVVPIVSVDGWSNLINSNPHFDGVTFDDHQDDKGNLTSITCNMYRKDRSHPVSVTEYMAECKRDTDPWRRWPRRMLRHKAMIQAARYAFGFAGIYDEDEGERIIEAKAIPEPPVPPPAPPQIESKREETPAYVDEYAAALLEAKTGDDMDLAWETIAKPHLDEMSKETYEALMVLEDSARSRIEG